MPDYEVGIQRKKITDDILSQIVAKTPSDNLMIEAAAQPVTDDSIRSLFKRFLENNTAKGQKR